MNTVYPAVCGVWSATRNLVAVVERDGRIGAAARITRTTEARWGYVAWLTASGVQLMVAPGALGSDPLLASAREAGIDVWLAPDSLVNAMRAVAALTRRPPRYSAAMLARWPAQQALRHHLRHLPTAPEQGQLQLW